jgi:hypothetical protein
MFSIYTVKGLAAVVLALALFVAAGTGCSFGGPPPNAQKVAESITAVGDEMGKCEGILDTVTNSIDHLQASGDLKPTFAEYAEAVADLEAVAKRIVNARSAVGANHAAYTEKWHKDQVSIDDPEARAAQAARQNKVAAQLDAVDSSMDKASSGFLPLLRNLQEIERSLASDPNVGGVAAMKTRLEEARAEAQRIKDGIGPVRAELAEVAGAMTSKPPK